MHLLAKGDGDRFGLLQFMLRPAAGFIHLGQKYFLIGHAAQIADQAEFFEGPDRPLGRVEIAFFHAVAVVVLKLVVVVVVAFAEGKKRHDRTVPCTAAAGVRLVSHGVADRVDEKCGVLDGKNTEHAGEKKCTESAGGSVPPIAEQGG